jgi:hypothetical protein
MRVNGINVSSTISSSRAQIASASIFAARSLTYLCCAACLGFAAAQPLCGSFPAAGERVLSRAEKRKRLGRWAGLRAMKQALRLAHIGKLAIHDCLV